jgi:hypothetical protein
LLRPYVKNRLRERVYGRAKGYSRLACQFAVLALVGAPASEVAGTLYVLLGLAMLAVLVIGLVVFPAVWSKKPARRKAALAVLKLILRWKG